MSDDRPADPTGTTKAVPRERKVSTSSSPEGEPPPRPPRELARADAGEREFEHEGRRWVAWLSGKSVWGTGSYGLGLVEAVHFADAAAPERPLREALLARGRFDVLYDSELAQVLESATPITGADRP